MRKAGATSLSQSPGFCQSMCKAWADRVKVLGCQVDVMQNLSITVRGIWCTAGNHYAGFWEKHGATIEGMTRLSMSRKFSVV